MALVLVWHEDADSTSAGAVTDVFPRRQVFFPDDGEEERAGAVHDCDVGEEPIFVVGLEGVDDAQEEGVLGGGAHGVVGYAGRVGAADPGGIG